VALHGKPIKAVRARVGHHKWEAQTGIKRPEVKAAYPDIVGALHSGFSVTIKPRRGRNLLLLEACSGHQWEAFSLIGFIVRSFGGVVRTVSGKRTVTNIGSACRQTIRAGSLGNPAPHPQLRQKTALFCIDTVLQFRSAFPPRCDTFGARALYPDWEICAVDDASQIQLFGVC
jgi:hypothetical protein